MNKLTAQILTLIFVILAAYCSFMTFTSAWFSEWWKVPVYLILGVILIMIAFYCYGGISLGRYK